VGLAFADHQLHPITEGDRPSLAAQRAQLADVIHIHDGVTVHPLELRLTETFFDGAQRLRGDEPLFEVMIQTTSRSA